MGKHVCCVCYIQYICCYLLIFSNWSISMKILYHEILYTQLVDVSGVSVWPTFWMLVYVGLEFIEHQGIPIVSRYVWSRNGTFSLHLALSVFSQLVNCSNSSPHIYKSLLVCNRVECTPCPRTTISMESERYSWISKSSQHVSRNSNFRQGWQSCNIWLFEMYNYASGVALLAIYYTK